LPVTALVVNPSRCAWAKETPTASRSASGPDAEARTSRDDSLPTGTNARPVHLVSEGRALLMLINPPRVLRPNSALCGPRTNSTWSTSRKSRLDELVLSCGTPSI
jgi:hypothetical protein